MAVTAFMKGFGMGAGLIVAIGSQNAFVLTSALRNQHVMLVAGLCILIDVALISAGVWGLGTLIQQFPWLLQITTWGGAVFLFIYGLLAFKRALHPSQLTANSATAASLPAAILTTLALSLLNPHVYLDTVILLGSLGGQLPQPQNIWFAIGAGFASLTWFSLLAWGGRCLAPWFANPMSWRLLDTLVGVTMWSIAFSLTKASLFSLAT
ncbi:LysE/ArgO family amino acid transporter [Thiolinea disciformis]|uniref:LysE/ArgO family amino acid transporter n=1 Tax=Thiolinea disciformis TaxID=125614 RepID=UPI0003825042|nr:LysE/ArgO family amino acid transporter [Thiolinea disciformis]